MTRRNHLWRWLVSECRTLLQPSEVVETRGLGWVASVIVPIGGNGIGIVELAINPAMRFGVPIKKGESGNLVMIISWVVINHG